MTAKAKMETAFFYGFPITTFGNDKKEENGFIFFFFFYTKYGNARLCKKFAYFSLLQTS